jgi:cbb3-type cytochrome oxidase maturation protein
LYFLLPLALVIAAVAVGAFVWAVRRGQYDDTDSPAMRAILDDDPVRPPREDAQR